MQLDWEKEFICETQLAEFSPDTLAPVQTHYWRIDQVQADDSIVEGMAWSYSLDQWLYINFIQRTANAASFPSTVTTTTV